VLIDTCKETSKILIQVSSSKFTFLKALSIKNFGEFMRFFLKGLSPFKIQTKFKCELFLEFLFKNPEGFGS
jgi:hypothetical protein